MRIIRLNIYSFKTNERVFYLFIFFNNNYSLQLQDFFHLF